MLCFARGCGGGKASFALFFHLVLAKLVLVSLIIKKKKKFSFGRVYFRICNF